MPTPATPDRYVVDRIGTPDPASSQYYVLDVVNDWMAREALARLGNIYRQHNQPANAQVCFDLLDRTLEAHAAMWELRNPKQKKSAKKDNARP